MFERFDFLLTFDTIDILRLVYSNFEEKKNVRSQPTHFTY